MKKKWFNQEMKVPYPVRKLSKGNVACPMNSPDPVEAS